MLNIYVTHPATNCEVNLHMYYTCLTHIYFQKYPSDFKIGNLDEFLSHNVNNIYKFHVIFLLLQGIFLFFLIKYKPLKYNNVYTYPDWGYGIGWFMAMSSMVCIPLGMIWMIWKTPGTFSEVKIYISRQSSDLYSSMLQAVMYEVHTTTTNNVCLPLQYVAFIFSSWKTKSYLSLQRQQTYDYFHFPFTLFAFSYFTMKSQQCYHRL